MGSYKKKSQNFYFKKRNIQNTVTIKSKQKQSSQHKIFSGWYLGPHFPLGSISLALHFVCRLRQAPLHNHCCHLQVRPPLSALLSTSLSSRVPHSSPLSSKHSVAFSVQTSNTTTVLPKTCSQVYHSNSPIMWFLFLSYLEFPLLW